MKKVIRYVSRLLDTNNRQLLNQYLGALHGRLEHEWVPGDSRSSDVVFVQTRYQLNDLPEGARPIAFMPREGSKVGEQAAVIDKPHLMQTFARSLNRSAGEALVAPHAISAAKTPDVDYIAQAWERAANSSAWPEWIDSVAKSQAQQEQAASAAPHPADSITINTQKPARPVSSNMAEARLPLSPLQDYASGLVTAFTSAAECVEHARRMAWPLVAISAPQGWRIFIDVAADRAYTRNAASRPFSGHARFLSLLRGACQVMPLSQSAFSEASQTDHNGEAQSYQRFAWELGLAQTDRLLPWIPHDGLLTVQLNAMPAGITLNAAHTQALQALSRGAIQLQHIERLRAPRHALIGLVNALELTRSIEIKSLASAQVQTAAAATPIFLRVPKQAA
jgi:hypothetical protein